MKRAIFVFILAALVLITVGFWFFKVSAKLTLVDITSLGVIILVIAFAVFLGFKRLGSAKRGEPVEDELSKKVMQKTAALSYYISLYLWLIVMYIQDKVHLETHVILAIGILGMAVTFAICWLFFNFRGIRNE